MFTDHDLRDLLNYAPNAPVLSVYLSTDPAEGNADAYKLRLRSMLKEIDLPEDVAAVLRYFDREHDWSGRSVVLFSCAGDDYFKVYTLQLNIRSRVRVSDKPFVKPLLDLLDFYGGYGVVLVDKQGARLFSFQLGELQERDGVLGESIRRTKRGGGSQATGRRGGVAGQTDHMDEITDRNIKETVGFATEFFSANNVRRILIGGADDTVALFRSQLPKTWQSLVVGTFPMSMTASQNEVLERSLRVGEAAERKREDQLVEALVTSSAKHRGAVQTMDDTLEAVRGGRVQTLVIQEGYRAPGQRCQGCGFITVQELEICPFCGSKFGDVPDAVEEAVRQVLTSGGEVEVVHGDHNPAGFSDIGALLRY
jgi:peptide subunit release factor 1 (eRF1)